MFNFDFLNILYSLPGIFIGLSFHEFAHAYAAYLLGDKTAKYQGRLTVDPLAHIDLFGFIALMLAGFGWAKPVPVNPLSFKDRKKGMILVSLAGPLMNFLLAFVTLIIHNLLFLTFRLDSIILYNIIAGIYWINLGLGVFNLIPLPPLDGSKILAGFLPPKQEFMLLRYEQYSYMILIILVYTGATAVFMDPVRSFVDAGIQNLVGLFF